MVRFLAFNVSRISATAEDMARHLSHWTQGHSVLSSVLGKGEAVKVIP